MTQECPMPIRLGASCAHGAAPTTTDASLDDAVTRDTTATPTDLASVETSTVPDVPSTPAYEAARDTLSATILPALDHPITAHCEVLGSGQAGARDVRWAQECVDPRGA
jgi:hypothetical protein